MFACLLSFRGAGFPVKPDYIPVVVGQPLTGING